MRFSQSLENLTREELIEELLQISDISCQLKALNDRFDTFVVKHEGLVWFVDNKELQYSSTPTNIIQLEWNALNKAQYHRRESLEVNLVPHDIGDNVLQETVCRAISLTGHEVTLMIVSLTEKQDRKLKKEIWRQKIEDRKLKCSIQINRKVLH